MESRLEEKNKEIASLKNEKILEKPDKSLDEIINDSHLFDDPFSQSPSHKPKEEEAKDMSLHFKTPSPKREGGRKMPITMMSHLEVD